LWPPRRGQFWTQGHNLNNFGRGPLDDAIYQNLKALGLVVSDKKIFENCILKTYFWPHDLHMQPIITIWTTLVGDHLGIIPAKFGQNAISGFRGECLSKKVYARQRTDDGKRLVTIAHSEHFVLRWAKKFTDDGRRQTKACYNSSTWALSAEAS